MLIQRKLRDIVTPAMKVAIPHNNFTALPQMTREQIAFGLGAEAARIGASIHDNPYIGDTLAQEWINGFNSVASA